MYFSFVQVKTFHRGKSLVTDIAFVNWLFAFWIFSGSKSYQLEWIGDGVFYQNTGFVWFTDASIHIELVIVAVGWEYLSLLLIPS